ncbi:uncharacterized protein LOC113311893 [Papaver somniferum]|uniref:uncharacterized protein LOC113311893 n=1 Tax=Papaver somniferum TaxID=3469 RepID=UPI000E6FF633|nr:uncharacterized protein LOC113311893 [Papaver somniferum]
MSCSSEPITYPCTICGDQSHIGPHCPMFYPSETTRDQVSVLHGGMNSKYEGRPKFDPYFNTYNPGWRHNPNFSWSKDNHLGGPYNNPPPCSSNHNEHVKAVITLRSGKTLENSVEPPKDSNPAEKETEVDQTSFKDPNGLESATSPSEDIPKMVYTTPASFPQRLAKKKTSTYAEILDIFKKVKINLPLLDAIKHVPAMSKFLKKMCTVKKEMSVHKKAFLTQQVSFIISQKYPVKFKDPGCPTVTCVIGKQTIENAFLDLGASVNLLPFSVYEQLGLGEMKPTRITLQLYDRSVKILHGIVEDVLVQTCLAHFGAYYVEDSHFEEVNALLDSAPVMNYGKWKRKTEPLPPTIDKPLSSSVKEPTLS